MRNFQSWVDDDGTGAEFGHALFSCAHAMFKAWQKVGEGRMSRTTFAYKICERQNAVARSLP